MTTHSRTGLEMDLGELLQEFQHVVEELSAPPLRAAPAWAAAAQDRDSDSGVEHSDHSREHSPGSSLNTSEEELSTAGVTITHTAKLGDTRDLQSFIENLDKELAEM